jgi:hypothetical protein
VEHRCWIEAAHKSRYKIERHHSRVTAMAELYENLERSLDRADVLLTELLAEYDSSLTQKAVSGDAVERTHDICEKLRGILDRTARRYWDLKVSPHLSEEDRKKASVYFPVAPDQNGFDSTLGRWR